MTINICNVEKSLKNKTITLICPWCNVIIWSIIVWTSWKDSGFVGHNDSGLFSTSLRETNSSNLSTCSICPNVCTEFIDFLALQNKHWFPKTAQKCSKTAFVFHSLTKITIKWFLWSTKAIFLKSHSRKISQNNSNKNFEVFFWKSNVPAKTDLRCMIDTLSES